MKLGVFPQKELFINIAFLKKVVEIPKKVDYNPKTVYSLFFTFICISLPPLV
jgi:hypothetical protein